MQCISVDRRLTSARGDENVGLRLEQDLRRGAEARLARGEEGGLAIGVLCVLQQTMSRY
jgi:hypothetical protein